MIPANQFFQMSKARPKGYKIIALRLEPETLKSRIIDKDVARAGRIGSIFKVEIPSVQCQGFAVDIKCDRRKSPVVAFRDQFAIWSLKKRLGYWPGGQQGIEHYEGQASGVGKQDRHQPPCPERAVIRPFERPDSAPEQADCCDRQRNAQLSTRS